MSGRAAGYCAGYDVPGYGNPGFGRGFGLGRGGGRGGGWGWRNRYYATGLPGWARFGYQPAWATPPRWAYGPYAGPPTREQETESLRAEAEWLQKQLEAIQKRVSELEQEQ